MKLQQLMKLAGIGIIVAIWVLSLMPLNQVAVPGGDKLHHFIAYGSLMLVWTLLHAEKSITQQLKLAVVFMAMGVLIECAQGLTTYRFFEWADALANSIGVILGWLMGRITTPYWLKLKQRGL
jgi:VanZ family protein